GPLLYNNPIPTGGSGLFIEAGDPSASDVVNLTGASGPVTVNLATQTVTGFGAPVSLSGVETLNLDAGANDINVVGTIGPDDISVTPTGTNTATVSSAGSNLTINATNSGLLTVKADGGSDKLTVNATQAGEVIDVSGTQVTVNVGVPPVPPSLKTV